MEIPTRITMQREMQKSVLGMLDAALVADLGVSTSVFHRAGTAAAELGARAVGVVDFGRGVRFHPGFVGGAAGGVGCGGEVVVVLQGVIGYTVFGLDSGVSGRAKGEFVVTAFQGLTSCSAGDSCFHS